MTILHKLEIMPQSTALLVVDVQKDFAMSEKGFAYYDRMVAQGSEAEMGPIYDRIHGYLIPLITGVRETGMSILYVKSVYPVGKFSDMPTLCCPDGEGKEFYAIEPNPENPNEHVVGKCDKNLFKSDNGLEGFLKKQNINTLLITGLVTHGCVRETTYAALEKGYSPVVVAECVSSSFQNMLQGHIRTLMEFAEHPLIGVVNMQKLYFQSSFERV